MNIGVIGLGSIGQRHVRNLRLLGHRVVGYDPDQAKMKDVNGFICTRDEMFKNSEAIVSASPSSQHINDLRTAVIFGNHILVEKPFAMRVTEELRALVQDASGVVMTGTNFRFHECVQKTKLWVRKGSIGEPIWAIFTVAQYTDKPPYKRDGVVLNWCSHEVDLALHILGPATVATASARINEGRDDMVEMVLQHEGGCRTMLRADYITIPEHRWFSICGTAGNIVADLVNGTVTMVGVSGMRVDHLAKANFEVNKMYIDEMREFVERIEREDHGDSMAGIRTLEVLDAVRQKVGLE